MTLTLSQIDHGDLCHGWSWVVQDEDKLAQQVARVALGQFRHVSKILTGVESADPATTHDRVRHRTMAFLVRSNPGNRLEYPAVFSMPGVFAIGYGEKVYRIRRMNSWKPASGGWRVTRHALRRAEKCRTFAARRAH